MIKTKPELVSPAGDWSSLLSAVEAGADCIYFGVKDLSMRNLATNFDLLELKKVMNYLHKNNMKGYLALNVVVMNNELKKIEQILKKAKSAKVDAVILSDMSVFTLAKKIGLNIHLSTQLSVSNTKALEFYCKLGAKRIVLARECSLNDIRDIIKHIHKKKLNCKIESFIHGAMCISVSGRCFISQYSHDKSANRGECLQPCRREYLIKNEERDLEYVVGKDYVLSAKDLCSIEFIDKLIESGIHSFKIEGRTRPPEYVKVVTSVYRRAIDLYFEKKLTNAKKKGLLKELYTVYNRGFSTGFYFGNPEGDVSRKLETKKEKIFLGEVVNFYKKIKVAKVLIRNGRLKKGDEILIVGKNTPASFTKADELQRDFAFVKSADKGESVGIKLPFIVRRKDRVFLWVKREDR